MNTDSPTIPADSDTLASLQPDPPQDLVAPIFEQIRKGELNGAAGETFSLLQTYPQSFVLLSLAATIHERMRKPDIAEKIARHCATLHPDMAAAHFNLGLSLRSLRRLNEALDAFGRAIELEPAFAEAYFHQGLIHYRMGNTDKAIASFDDVLQRQPDMAAAHYYRASSLAAKGELKQAVIGYSHAIKHRQNFAEAYNDMGNVLMSLSQMNAAETAFKNAVRFRPDLALAHENLGIVLSAKHELAAAVESFDRACKLNPASQSALAHLLYTRAQICDFSGMNSDDVARVSDTASPFTMLALEDAPERHFQRATNHWKRRAGLIKPLPLPARPHARAARLRVGYFSSDIHEHATLRLMSGLLREHDKTRFDIFMYSYGLGKEGPLREKVRQDVENFHDIQQSTNAEIIKLVRSHELDIAIDLKGYTSGTRSELFGYRLAPLQINYLGYPGTMASEAFDYILADSTVIPQDERDHYSENVIYMPNSYQPNDIRRRIAATTSSRADFGLPETGFVFSCFNNSYKIGVAEFDIWMRLLQRVEGSVLWLLTGNVELQQNLRKEAALRDVAPDRLVFSGKISYEQHLGRHKHANLFLDTFNYNAHTTTSDALWAGLPVVTKPGRQFSSRVAASLLKAIGLPELICDTQEDYEHTALYLATNPDVLRKVRDRLSANRFREPLFDTIRYTRNFETGLDLAYDRYLTGKPPCDIIIPDRSSPR